MLSNKVSLASAVEFLLNGLKIVFSIFNVAIGIVKYCYLTDKTDQ